MSTFRVFAGFCLVSVALATPFQRHVFRNESSPCAQVSASVALQRSVAIPTVPAQLAYDCITSVPFNKSAALDLVNTITPYIRWQSNTVWLKDPPEEYAERVQPGFDVWGELETIWSNVETESYKNEFEFGWAVYRLTQKSHDGHFIFVPDVIGTVFNWARPVPLVSVSEDGEALPKPFVYLDILAASFGNSSFTPSAITKINGQNASDYLEDWAQFGSLQDRDALYNNVFYNLAAVSIGSTSTSMGTFAGSGRGRWVYPGAETRLEFENGTSVTYTNYARVLVSLTGVTDGTSLYKKYFITPKPTGTGPPPSNSTVPAPSNSTIPTSSTTLTPSATPTPTATPAPGYPPPVLREIANNIGGYYLPDAEYSDIAVLSVPSFVSELESEIPFQETGSRFLALARAAGKKKLIIDVSANGGGTILQGYDLYKQLFPSGIDHAAGDRFRAFESTDLIGRKFSETAEGLSREFVTEEQNETLYWLQYDVISSTFNYETDLEEDNTNFESWPDKFGPVAIAGDNFTNLMRWNLSDGLTPLNSGGIWVHGYRNLTNITQPFAAEDIIVVTDGYCASTCTIFSELLRQRQGVRFISLGGRPRPGLTQAIGGVKGTNNFPWYYIQYLAQYTVDGLSSSPEEAASLNKTELGEYWSDTPFFRQAPGTSLNVNFRDGWRDEDLGGFEYPLQFHVEEADCRILYTKEMTVDVTAIWRAVADSAWGGKSRCVAGGLGGSGGKDERKREVGVLDTVLKKRMAEWKKGLKAEDYPMDLFTDFRGKKITAQGFMYP